MQKPEEFRIEIAAFDAIGEFASKYGRPAALDIWMQAEEDAIAAGEDYISLERLRRVEREYIARQ